MKQPPAVVAALAVLERSDLVTELTSKRRGRVFSYARYTAIVSKGTNVPARR